MASFFCSSLNLLRTSALMFVGLLSVLFVCFFYLVKLVPTVLVDLDSRVFVKFESAEVER